MPPDLTPEEVKEARIETHEKPILKLSDEDKAVWLYELEGTSYTLASSPTSSTACTPSRARSAGRARRASTTTSSAKSSASA